MASTYEYKRIDLATDAIRLVLLVRGAIGQPIKCEMLETYLHQTKGIPYEALSYVWGAREAVERIWLDRCPLTITENLYEALENLRQPDEDRLLWIDAICIDQGNDAERGHQVGQMRLVYQCAHNVVIWFGASNFYIDRLFDWMATLDKQMLQMPRPHTMEKFENTWASVISLKTGQQLPHQIAQALRDLLRRDWFTRIWVLQEAAVAKSAIITCGRKRVHSRTFVIMPSLLNVSCREAVQARLDIMPGLLREGSWWAGINSQGLSILLQKFGQSKASDPRDIIYALIGLCADAYNSNALRPDYEVSLQQAIKNTVAYLLNSSGNLPHYPRIEDLPSCNMAEFLDALHDLPGRTFIWAANNCKDKLLADLINCQSAKKSQSHYQDWMDTQSIYKYMTHISPHGPLLAIAIKKANLDLFELLLKYPGVDISTPDSHGRTPMLLATGQKNPLFAERLSEISKIVTGQRDCNGDTPLLAAVKDGDLEVIQYILGRPGSEVFVNEVDSKGDGPMNIAARRGDEKTVSILLKTFTDPAALRRGSDGMTPLKSAAVGGHNAVYRWLLNRARATMPEAARVNDLDFVCRVLEEFPGCADGQWGVSRTPLGAAAESGNTDMVALLLNYGTKVNSRDRSGHTPLWTASATGRKDTVKLLLDRGADKTITCGVNGSNSTPLGIAASHGHVDVVVCLLDAGANIDTGTRPPHPDVKHLPEVRILFWAAASGGHLDAVSALAKRGAHIEATWMTFIDAKDNSVPPLRVYASPLWIAASLGHSRVVKLLIQLGAEIDARDSKLGMTPFWRAAHQNRTEVMMVLIQAGANIRKSPLRAMASWRRFPPDAVDSGKDTAGVDWI